MAAPEIKISVGDLDAGGKQFTFPLRAAWIRGILEDHEATAGSDGTLDVRASRSGNDVVVHGTLEASLVVPCARCLTPVSLVVDQPLSLLFVPGKVTPLPVSRKAGATKPTLVKSVKLVNHDKLEREEPPKEGDKKSASTVGAGARAAKATKKKRKPEPEEYELSPEEADTLPYDGDVIVLDDVIRDELILETPIFPLCSEDCAGMSPPPDRSRVRGPDDLPLHSPSDQTVRHDPPNGQAPLGKTSSTHGNSKTSGNDSAGGRAIHVHESHVHESHGHETNGHVRRATEEGPPDIDPRLLPLLRVKPQRD